jgi:hypothetical protein
VQYVNKRTEKQKEKDPQFYNATMFYTDKMPYDLAVKLEALDGAKSKTVYLNSFTRNYKIIGEYKDDTGNNI